MSLFSNSSKVGDENPPVNPHTKEAMHAVMAQRATTHTFSLPFIVSLLTPMDVIVLPDSVMVDSKLEFSKSLIP